MNTLPHALRTVAAALLAVGLAYQLQLETPYSAATTVLIVAHPVHGAILSKSLYRLGGTIVGAVAAVVLMAAFAQTPEMFILGLSVWMGLCAFASTLLRNFRSYGAILAGYTVVLITMPAVASPEAVFILALNRLAVVGLGVLCSAVVASLTTARGAESTLTTRLARAVGDLAAYARLALTSAAAGTLTSARRKLAGEIAALDTLAEFAALEVAVGMTDIAEGVRGAVMAMFGALTAASSVHESLARLQGAQPLDNLLPAIDDLLKRLTGRLDGAALDAVRAEMAALGERLEALLIPGDLPLLAAVDRLDEMLTALRFGIDGLAAVAGRQKRRRVTNIRPHLDLRWAAINGLRAAVAVWVAGAVWFTTGWSAGGSMVAMVVPTVGLLSLRDRPAEDALSFVWGTAMASAVGFAYVLLILPQISGFPLLALALAVPLLVAVMLSLSPRTAFASIGFYVFFLTLLAPSNPFTYAPEVFLNNALATMAGAVLTALVHRLVLPVDGRRHVRALIRVIRNDLRALMRSDTAMAADLWEARMHDRLIQLGSRMRAAGLRGDNLLRGGFAALRLGREVLRLRALLPDRAARALAEPALRSLRHGERRSATLAASRHAADELLALAAERPDDAKALARCAAALTEIAVLLGRHRLFFTLAASP